MRFLVSARGENDVSRSNLARGSPEEKCPMVPRLQARHRHAFTNRSPETPRVPDQVADNLALGHESVRIISAVVAARQLDRPVGDDKAEAVPAPTPCLADPAPLENDVVNALNSELVAERQPRLSSADDYDIGGRLHRRPL